LGTGSSSYLDLYQRLRQAWSIETSSKWLSHNPASGQCGVTALVVQDILGGEILKTDIDGAWHFYNRIDERRVDFTMGQFDSPIAYDDHLSSRHDALNDTTMGQYELLRKRLGLTEKKRTPVLAEIRFAERRSEFQNLGLAERFGLIYRTNFWGAESSSSGVGSELAATKTLRREFSDLLRRLQVKSLLDLPCGDFTWMSEVDLQGIQYTGADIVDDVVKANAETYGNDHRQFSQIDLVSGSIPRSDLVLCRDCLVHLSFAQINQAIANLKRSGSRWLLTTTFPDVHENRDIEAGDWRPLNLQSAPFFFPNPVQVIVEDCSEAGGDYADKSLGLWAIDGLPQQGSLDRAGQSDA
jgi:hypothetical protein